MNMMMFFGYVAEAIDSELLITYSFTLDKSSRRPLQRFKEETHGAAYALLKGIHCQQLISSDYGLPTGGGFDDSQENDPIFSSNEVREAFEEYEDAKSEHEAVMAEVEQENLKELAAHLESAEKAFSNGEIDKKRRCRR